MNQRGQAMIEMAMLSSLLIIGLILIVRMGLALHLSLVIDELIESAQLCELQQKPLCRQQLTAQLQDLNFKNIHAVWITSQNTSRLKLYVESNLERVFEKESELTLDLQVP